MKTCSDCRHFDERPAYDDGVCWGAPPAASIDVRDIYNDMLVADGVYPLVMPGARACGAFSQACPPQEEPEIPEVETAES